MTTDRMIELIKAGEDVQYHGGREFADQLIAEGRMNNAFTASGELIPQIRKFCGESFARGVNDRAHERMKVTFA